VTRFVRVAGRNLKNTALQQRSRLWSGSALKKALMGNAFVVELKRRFGVNSRRRALSND
jgi:hypothetical protein